MSRTNPFTPGAGRRPPCLAGREAEQHQLAAMLSDMKETGEGQIVVLHGPRGMGKTVLLDWLEGECGNAEAATVANTPSEGLSRAEDLPSLLLPDGWRPEGISIGIKGVLSMEWKAPATGTSGNLRAHLVEACRKQPRVLLLDEAHTLDADLCRGLLNTAQGVTRQAPFLLVMAGTPGLVPFLMSVGATFVERSKRLSIGRLDEPSAANAIRLPLKDGGIAIDDDALARVVGDAQGYPYFLQLWGHKLWELAEQRGQKTLAGAQVNAAMAVIAEEREGFYDDRYDVLDNDKRLLLAAYAVACAFKGKGSLHQDDMLSAIEISLGDSGGDVDSRWKEARRLGRELNRIDFIWRPSRASKVEPGIPSFMSYVRCRLERNRQHAPDADRGKADDDMKPGM